MGIIPLPNIPLTSLGAVQFFMGHHRFAPQRGIIEPVALKAVRKLGELHSKFGTAEGDGQQATNARNAAHGAMAKWVSEYRRLAKIALRGKPGMLAKLRSHPRKKLASHRTFRLACRPIWPATHRSRPAVQSLSDPTFPLPPARANSRRAR